MTDILARSAEDQPNAWNLVGVTEDGKLFLFKISAASAELGRLGAQVDRRPIGTTALSALIVAAEELNLVVTKEQRAETMQ